MNASLPFRNFVAVFLFLVCSYSNLLGQPLPSDIQWKYISNFAGQNVFHEVIESSNGYLVGVGKADDFKSGKNGLMVILDHNTGQSNILGNRRHKVFTRSESDVFHDVVQAKNGFLWMVGETMTNGKSDGWLVGTDITGMPSKNKPVGVSLGAPNETDGFNKIASLDEHRLLVGGTRGKGKKQQIWLAVIQDWKIVWQDLIPDPDYESITDLVVLPDGGFLAVGNTTTKINRGDVWMVKYDQYFNKVPNFNNYLGEPKTMERVNAAILTSDGNIALTGFVESEGGNAWLAPKINVNNGRKLVNFEQYGGNGWDEAFDLVETNDKGFILTGRTKSHQMGANYFNANLVKINASFDKVWELTNDDFFGIEGDRNDVGFGVVQLHDGSLAFAGSTGSNGPGKENALLVKLNASIDQIDGMKAGNSNMLISNASIFSEDGFLRPNQNTYFSFEVSNPNNFDLNNLRIEASQQNQGSNTSFTFWPTVYTKKLNAKGDQTIEIPISSSETLVTKDHTVNLKVYANAGNALLGEKTVTIKTKNPSPAQLTLEDSPLRFQTDDQESLILFEPSFRNTGDKTLENVVLELVPPRGLKCLNYVDNKVKLGFIYPNESKSEGFIFTRKANFDPKVNDELFFKCLIYSEGKLIDEKELSCTLERSNSAQLNSGAISLVSPVLERGSGPVVTDVSDPTQVIRFIVKLPSGVKDAILNINGQPLEPSKMGEAIITPPDDDAEGLPAQDILFKVINLPEPGKYEFTLEVVTNDNKVIPWDKTLYLNYNPQAINLHILSIGPVHDDLKYTSNDAYDFANAFLKMNQLESIFSRVNATVLSSYEETTFIEIRKAMEDLNRQGIKNNDLLVCFISSHGSVEKDNFKITPSDFAVNGGLKLDYINDILGSLDDINCKKIIFVDACHSGAAGVKDDINPQSIINQITNSKEGYNIIVSSSEDQVSFEDDAWKNGAFTEAIVEAFQNVEVTDESGTYKAGKIRGNHIDSNDNILKLNELVEFLQRRVPELVKTKKKGATQIPQLLSNESGGNLPIYIIDNK